jgi:hypothetical protein
MDRQNNEDTKQDTKGVNWWTDKTIKIPNRIPKVSIDWPTKQWRYQTEYQSCQLMNRQNNKDTKQNTKAVNRWTYPVWYLYCFVGPSIDSFGILFGIFIVLSVHQLTPLVSCLVSLLLCRKYQSCKLMDRQNNKDTKQDTKAVNWWTDKTIKIPNRIPKVSIDGPTKQ